MSGAPLGSEIVKAPGDYLRGERCWERATTGPNRALRVAIGSCGLGHVRRGIEAWAEDTAAALHRRGVNVSLFGGAPGPGLFESLHCMKRHRGAARSVARVFRRLGGWRYGLGSAWDVEQTTFAFFLWLQVRREYDIVHVQDPTTGKILDHLHRLGLSRPRVILANGTDESVEWLSHLSAVQELSAVAASRWPRRGGNRHPAVFCVPNFINLKTFSAGDHPCHCGFVGGATAASWQTRSRIALHTSSGSAPDHHRCVAAEASPAALRAMSEPGGA